MGLLDSFLSGIDNFKRKTAKNIWDAVTNPSDFANMTAARMQEDRYGGPEEAYAMKQYLSQQPYDKEALKRANEVLARNAVNEGIGSVGSIKVVGEYARAKQAFNDLSEQVEKAKQAFAADRSRSSLNEYNRLLQARDDAQSIMNQWRPVTEAAESSYKGQHSAPMKDSGAPLNDITKGGYYPDDVYGPNGLRYYGTGDERLDAAAYSVIRNAQGNPFAQVKMFRAVPSDAPSVINNGDWVTTVRQYAKDHGESALNGDYKIVSKTVPAKKLFTNGDSWLEFGYDQSGRIDPAVLGALSGGGLLGLGAYSSLYDQR